MRWVFGLIFTAALICAVSASPSVLTIERAFNLFPGRTFPIVMPTGQQLQVQYLRIDAMRNGEYAVVVRVIQ